MQKLSILILVSFIFFKGNAQNNPSAQKKQSLKTKICREVNLDYLLYLPKEYKTQKNARWPLMIFLHGSGERGNNLDLVKKNGPPKLIEEGKEFPFLIVSPQCPEKTFWSEDDLYELIQSLIKNYRVDEKQIYLTGLSMGGYGTWTLAIKHPELFAAVAPVCGASNRILQINACNALSNTPVWVFHGAKDHIVPVADSDKMVEALKKCNNNVKYTVYPEADHDSWTETYNNPEFYKWLTEQKKP